MFYNKQIAFINICNILLARYYHFYQTYFDLQHKGYILKQ